MDNSLKQWPKVNKPRAADRVGDSPVVMVVEDEFLIRIMITDELRTAGYEVVECGTADEAIDVLRSGISIGVMFTDIRMPGSMDGASVAQSGSPGVSGVAGGRNIRRTTAGDADRAIRAQALQPRSVVHLIDALTGMPARADS